LAGRFLEDFAVGEVIASGEEYEITPENIATFAAAYDPQPIHLDAKAAAAGMFGGIVSSGWQTASVSMRLVVRSQIFGGGPVVGVGIDKLRFLKPVRAGDRLQASAEVVEIRPSNSDPSRGYLILRITTARQDGDPVMTQEWTVLVPRRPAQ
jgi:acyl dehydratase